MALHDLFVDSDPRLDGCGGGENERAQGMIDVLRGLGLALEVLEVLVEAADRLADEVGERLGERLEHFLELVFARASDERDLAQVERALQGLEVVHCGQTLLHLDA